MKTNGNRRHFGHSILGTVSSPFLPSEGVAVQEGIYFSSLDTCKPQPFSGISLGTAQGKYFHEISSESKGLPVGPCCLCVVADLLWGSVLAFPQWLRYTDLKGIKFLEPCSDGKLDSTFSLLWEGSQPSSCSLGHLGANLEGTFQDLSESSLY